VPIERSGPMGYLSDYGDRILAGRRLRQVRCVRRDL